MSVRSWLPAWMTRHGAAVPVAVVVFILLIWGFGAVGDEVFEGETRAFDEAVLRATRNPENAALVRGPPIVTEIMRDLTALGGVVVTTFITLSVAGLLLLRRKPRAVVAVVVAIGGGALGSFLLKGLFDRPRPTIVPHLSIVMTSSFPSGHSALSAVVYLTLASMLVRLVEERLVKIYILANAVLLTVAVGVSRVVLGVHYPTDVVGGWMAGCAWATLCWLALRLLQRENVVAGAGEPES